MKTMAGFWYDSYDICLKTVTQTIVTVEVDVNNNFKFPFVLP